GALSSHSSRGLPGRARCTGSCVITFPGLAEAEKVPGRASFATDVLARSWRNWFQEDGSGEQERFAFAPHARPTPILQPHQEPEQHVAGRFSSPRIPRGHANPTRRFSEVQGLLRARRSTARSPTRMT